jgi:hypothetical protein
MEDMVACSLIWRQGISDFFDGFDGFFECVTRSWQVVEDVVGRENLESLEKVFPQILHLARPIVSYVASHSPVATQPIRVRVLANDSL